ncbi:nucleoside kinase [Butyrivibrio sp. NC3005]|uniref:nucleoside kinase n=1 Tax=Butyrivibrio sp. NC3005 TaxID=1280685 RepID=UPI0004088A37|nr:nucleoside kinase [Butyrivibrio sp. NC3005]
MPTLIIQGEKKNYEKGCTFEDVANEYQVRYSNQIALVIFNGKIQELFKRVDKDGVVSFITTSDNIGHKTYCRTATMMLIKAVHDVEPKLRTKVEFSVGYGFFCHLFGDVEVTDELVLRIQKRMEEMRESALPITKRTYPLDDAREIFREQGMMDKVNLFRYRRASEINVYRMDGFCDYFYGYMLPNTSYVTAFEVKKYRNGIMLNLPPTSDPTVIHSFAPREKIVDQMLLSNEWGHKMGIDDVGDLNNAICRSEVSELILVQEALQEHRIGQIAEKIYSNSNIKFVMIAGPSSSGKTSFANRLSIQLRAHGMIPHLISLDNYFKNRIDTPKDENGNYDFESLEAMDLVKFNEDMTRLLNGEEIEMPVFNFVTGTREYKGDKLLLGASDVLVLEGIHGLNDQMSYSLPKESKFRVYVSALTTLNVDAHNRISTTDARLIRRMVRDARTRGASGRRTIHMWPLVRAGEEKNIFPFQESADEMFNSAQIYELAVLKNQAEPLLFSITKDDPEYYEAKRLLKFLDYFIGIDSSELPGNSIVREFVGGSIFNV